MRSKWHDYERALKRAGKALIAAEVALSTAEAMGPKHKEPYVRDLRDEVARVESRVREWVLALPEAT